MVKKYFTVIKSNMKKYPILVKIVRLLKKMFRYTYGIFLPESIIYSYLIFPICAWCRVHRIPGFYSKYKNLENVKNRHLNEKVFICCTGPSLTKDDLLMLENEITIGVNSIFLMYEDTDWRPTYYTLADRDVYNRMFKKNNVIEDDLSKREMFFSSFLRKKITSKKALFFSMSWLTHWVYYGTGTFKYSEDLIYGIYDAYTVTNVAINIAQYMGAKEIYLIGCDCNFLGKRHAGQENSKDAKTQKEFNEDFASLTQNVMIKGYTFIKNEMDKRGIRVYNATRGGCLEVFPRVRLEDVIG